MAGSLRNEDSAAAGIDVPNSPRSLLASDAQILQNLQGGSSFDSKSLSSALASKVAPTSPPALLTWRNVFSLLFLVAGPYIYFFLPEFADYLRLSEQMKFLLPWFELGCSSVGGLSLTHTVLNRINHVYDESIQRFVQKVFSHPWAHATIGAAAGFMTAFKLLKDFVTDNPYPLVTNVVAQLGGVIATVSIGAAFGAIALGGFAYWRQTKILKEEEVLTKQQAELAKKINALELERQRVDEERRLEKLNLASDRKELEGGRERLQMERNDLEAGKVRFADMMKELEQKQQKEAKEKEEREKKLEEREERTKSLEAAEAVVKHRQAELKEKELAVKEERERLIAKEVKLEEQEQFLSSVEGGLTKQSCHMLEFYRSVEGDKNNALDQLAELKKAIVNIERNLTTRSRPFLESFESDERTTRMVRRLSSVGHGRLLVAPMPISALPPTERGDSPSPDSSAAEESSPLSGASSSPADSLPRPPSRSLSPLSLPVGVSSLTQSLHYQSPKNLQKDPLLVSDSPVSRPVAS